MNDQEYEEMLEVQENETKAIEFEYLRKRKEEHEKLKRAVRAVEEEEKKKDINYLNSNEHVLMLNFPGRKIDFAPNTESSALLGFVHVDAGRKYKINIDIHEFFNKYQSKSCYIASFNFIKDHVKVFSCNFERYDNITNVIANLEKSIDELCNFSDNVREVLE